MKRNKLAAGALALALGLGAVAPSFADDTTYVTTTLPKSVEEKVVVDGTTLTRLQFEETLENASKSYNEYLAARKEYDRLKEAYDIALDRYNKAYEAYEAEKLVTEDGKKVEREKLNNFEIAVESVRDFIGATNKPSVQDFRNYLDNGHDLREGSWVKSKTPLKPDATAQKGEFDQALDRVKKAYAELIEAENSDDQPATESEKYREYIASAYEKDRLKELLDDAEKAAKDARSDFEADERALRYFAEAFNVIVTATNNGIVVVDEEDDAEEEKEIDYEALRASVARAKETLRAVEILKDLTPNTAANNQATLDALVVEQKAKVAKAEAILEKAGKKVALISTAYASEEEVTAEEVDELIKELDDNTEAIQKELKEIDKDVKVEEDKPAEDDKEEDKSEDKEDKEEDKADDKKDDDKKADKKPAQKPVQKSTNKTAGSNAKTGIAGVAGVAGVLAAASVAYAASKKNN